MTEGILCGLKGTTAGHEDIEIGTVFLVWPRPDGTQLDGDSHSDTGHECDPDFRLEEEGMFGVEVADRIFRFCLRPIHLDAFNQFRLHESIPWLEQQPTSDCTFVALRSTSSQRQLVIAFWLC